MVTKPSKKTERSKSAFDGTSTSKVFMFDPDELVLVDDPKHPLYDIGVNDPPDPERVKGIRAKGILQNVVIIKDDDDRPVIAAGRHRVIDAREANRQLKAEGLPAIKIPCVYRHEKPHEAVATMLMENFHRADRSLSRNAQAVRQAKVAGYDVETIAGMVKKSVATVENWLAVSDLHEDVQQALDEERIRLNDAIRVLGKLPRNQQIGEMRKLEKERPTRKTKKEEREKTGVKGTVQVSPARRFKKLKTFTDDVPQAVPRELLTILMWMNGTIDDEKLKEDLPALAPMFVFDAKTKAAKTKKAA